PHTRTDLAAKPASDTDKTTRPRKASFVRMWPMTLHVLTQRPDLGKELDHPGLDPGPTVMFNGTTAHELWPRLTTEFSDFQLLLTHDDRVIARAHSAPLAWHGSKHDLPPRRLRLGLATGLRRPGRQKSCHHRRSPVHLDPHPPTFGRPGNRTGQTLLPDQRRRDPAPQHPFSHKSGRTPRRRILPRLPVHTTAGSRPGPTPAALPPHQPPGPPEQRRPGTTSASLAPSPAAWSVPVSHSSCPPGRDGPVTWTNPHTCSPPTTPNAPNRCTQPPTWPTTPPMSPPT